MLGCNADILENRQFYVAVQKIIIVFVRWHATSSRTPCKIFILVLLSYCMRYYFAYAYIHFTFFYLMQIL